MVHLTEILTTLAALLLGVLASGHPRVARWLGRWGFWGVLAGLALPTLDHLVPLAMAADRIAFLTRKETLHAPFYGLLAIAACGALTWFLTDGHRAARAMGWLAAGYLAHLLLTLLTPAGIPLFLPGSELRVALPLFPEGHPLLIAGLAGALALARAVPPQARRIRLGAGALVGLYALAGASLYPVAAAQVAGRAPPAGYSLLEPGGLWPFVWRYTIVDGERYLLGKARPFAGRATKPRAVARWNDEPTLVALLGDPVVNRFYHHVFRHPVARLETTLSQTTLTLADVWDAQDGGAGASFVYEVNPDGGTRLYRVKGFAY